MSDDDEIFGMIIGLPLLLPVITSLLVGFWDGVRLALMERHLVAGPGETIVEVPGWDGAGLAGVHIVVISCALVTMMVIATTAAEQRRRRTIDTEGWGTT